jgi:hypothetical protein
MTGSCSLLPVRHHGLGVVSGRALYDVGVRREEAPGAALVFLTWLRAAVPGTAAHAATARLDAFGVPHSWHVSWEYLELDFQCLSADAEKVLDLLPEGDPGGADAPDEFSYRHAIRYAHRLHERQTGSGVALGASSAAQALDRACLDRYGLAGVSSPVGIDRSVLTRMWKGLRRPEVIVLAGDTTVGTWRPGPPAVASIPPSSLPPRQPVCHDDRVCVTVAFEASSWPSAAMTAAVLENRLVERLRHREGLAYEISCETRSHCVLAQVSGGQQRRAALVSGMVEVVRRLPQVPTPEWQQAARLARARAIAARQRSDVVADRVVEMLASEVASPGQELRREMDVLHRMTHDPVDSWRPDISAGILVVAEPNRPATKVALLDA